MVLLSNLSTVGRQGVETLPLPTDQERTWASVSWPPANDPGPSTSPPAARNVCCSETAPTLGPVEDADRHQVLAFVLMRQSGAARIGVPALPLLAGA